MRLFLFSFLALALTVFFAIPNVVSSIEAQEQAPAENRVEPKILTEEGKKSLEKRLIEMMQILYVNEKYQSPFDRVEIRGADAFIQVWRDLPQNPVKEKVECLGYQWLLSGRGEKMGFGALDVFKEFPQLQSIQLELVEAEDTVKSVNKKGKLAKDWKLTPYLKYRLDREEILKFSADRENLKRNLRRDQASCLKIGRRVKMLKEINL